MGLPRQSPILYLTANLCAEAMERGMENSPTPSPFRQAGSRPLLGVSSAATDDREAEGHWASGCLPEDISRSLEAKEAAKEAARPGHAGSQAQDERGKPLGDKEPSVRPYAD